MLIPSEEIADYHWFLSSIVRGIGSLTVDPETVLWHYTNGNGLVGILESNSLYSTQVSCLNDSTEIRFSSALFREALARLVEKHIEGSRESTFVKQTIEFFKENIEIPNHVHQPYFVACFSERKDDLSQWRTYGGGENGYAIGFKASDLSGVPGAIFVKVAYYKPEEHLSAIDKVADQTVTFFLEGFEKYGQGNLEEWTATFLTIWDSSITQIAPVIKDPGFESECEYRIIKKYTDEEQPNLVFTAKTSILARHLPIRPSPTQSARYKLPVHEVMIGPCRYPQVNRFSVASLLNKCGHGDKIVSLSERPYQAT